MSITVICQIELDLKEYGFDSPYVIELFHENITGNVAPMWGKAGCYEVLYKSSGKTLGEVLPILESAFQHMKENPEVYKPLEPKNGWGSFDGALMFLYGLVKTARKHSRAIIWTY